MVEETNDTALWVFKLLWT